MMERVADMSLLNLMRGGVASAFGDVTGPIGRMTSTIERVGPVAERVGKMSFCPRAFATREERRQGQSDPDPETESDQKGRRGVACNRSFGTAIAVRNLLARLAVAFTETIDALLGESSSVNRLFGLCLAWRRGQPATVFALVALVRAAALVAARHRHDSWLGRCDWVFVGDREEADSPADEESTSE
jgi:hypothetical protein